LTVRRVVNLLALYPNRDDVLREYPELEPDDLQQALLDAATALDNRVIKVPFSYENAA